MPKGKNPRAGARQKAYTERTKANRILMQGPGEDEDAEAWYGRYTGQSKKAKKAARRVVEGGKTRERTKRRQGSK